MKTQWKDISSFSQSDKVRTPRTFEAVAGGLLIVVTRHTHLEPNEWGLTCDPWFDVKVISKGTADEAKAIAIDLVRAKLMAALDALSDEVAA